MTFSLTCLHLFVSGGQSFAPVFWSAAGSLSFCLCGFSDSGLLGYDFVSLWLRVSVPGPRSDSSGPPLPRHVPRGIRLCLCSCLGLPHPRRARPPSPTPVFGLSDRPGFVSCASAPRPAPSGVSAALRRPLSAWVFPPPLSLGQPLDLFVSPGPGGWRCLPIPQVGAGSPTQRQLERVSGSQHPAAAQEAHG